MKRINPFVSLSISEEKFYHVNFVCIDPLIEDLMCLWLSGKFGVTAEESFKDKYIIDITQTLVDYAQATEVKLYLSDRFVAHETAKFIAGWYRDNRFMVDYYYMSNDLGYKGDE